MNYSQLTKSDIVLTTYGTLAAEFGKRKSKLDQIVWYRIVLDEGKPAGVHEILKLNFHEAHVIRNWSTKQFRAASAINAHIRWCLTGTPIQNTLEDLGALVSFLKTPILEERTTFRRYITPRRSQGQRVTIKDFDNLRRLLKSICLRRNKRVLPLYQSADNWTSVNYDIKFSDLERSQYTQLAVACREAILTAVNGHTTKAAHRTVLEQLLRLRMFCNNGQNSLRRIAATNGDQSDLLSILQQSEDAICVYCSCDITSLGHVGDDDSAIVTVCQHLVCHECRSRYESDITKPRKLPYRCPRCEGGDNATDDMFPRSIDTNEILNTGATSLQYPSKLVRLMKDVEDHRSQGKRYVFAPDSILYSLTKQKRRVQFLEADTQHCGEDVLRA